MQTGIGSQGYRSATKTRDTACNGCGREPAHFRVRKSDNATRNTRETPPFCCSERLDHRRNIGHRRTIVLDFTTTPVTAAPSKLSANQESAPPIKPIWTAERLIKTKKCPVASIGVTMEDANQEMTEECAIPKFGRVSTQGRVP